MNETYRLRFSTLAILNNNGKSSPMALPVGAIVKLHRPLVDAGGFVEAECDGQSVQLLACHLMERGVRVSGGGK